jgi:hypothetical protein
MSKLFLKIIPISDGSSTKNREYITEGTKILNWPLKFVWLFVGI